MFPNEKHATVPMPIKDGCRSSTPRLQSLNTVRMHRVGQQKNRRRPHACVHRAIQAIDQAIRTMLFDPSPRADHASTKFVQYFRAVHHDTRPNNQTVGQHWLMLPRKRQQIHLNNGFVRTDYIVLCAVLYVQDDAARKRSHAHHGACKTELWWIVRRTRMR